MHHQLYSSYVISYILAQVLLLRNQVAKQHLTVDEHRRCVEALEPHVQNTSSYYEKWALAMCSLMLEKGVLTEKQLDAQLGPKSATEQVLLKTGDKVRVKTATFKR